MGNEPFNLRPVKNLIYPTPEELFPSHLVQLIQRHGMRGVEVWAKVLLGGQQAQGVQFVVDKGVSDDLINSDIRGSVSFSSVPWPSKFMEFYFEDLSIPTLIVSVTSRNDLEAAVFPRMGRMIATEVDRLGEGVDENVPLYRMTYSFKHPDDRIEVYYMALRMEEMEDYVHGRVPLNEHQIKDASEMTSQEDLQTQLYCSLVAKVLIYSSIPQFRPIPILGKKSYPKYGGKPEVKNRPHRPAMHVQYLPKVVAQFHRGWPHKHSFRGRRGHFHHYGVTEAGKKRFRNRAGTYDWFPPIKDPVTGQVPKPIFKVRKPKFCETVT